MRLEPISPWAESADRVSPDGRFQAIVRHASEIAMGAPTSGALVIRDSRDGGRVVRELESCSPSFVWSDRSDALAVPQWTRDRMQRLLIVPLPRGVVTTLPDEYRVLELHAFEDGVVSGVDSPIHMPRLIRVAGRR